MALVILRMAFVCSVMHNGNSAIDANKGRGLVRLASLSEHEVPSVGNSNLMGRSAGLSRKTLTGERGGSQIALEVTEPWYLAVQALSLLGAALLGVGVPAMVQMAQCHGIPPYLPDSDCMCTQCHGAWFGAGGGILGMQMTVLPLHGTCLVIQACSPSCVDTNNGHCQNNRMRCFRHFQRFCRGRMTGTERKAGVRSSPKGGMEEARD